MGSGVSRQNKQHGKKGIKSRFIGFGVSLLAMALSALPAAANTKDHHQSHTKVAHVEVHAHSTSHIAAVPHHHINTVSTHVTTHVTTSHRAIHHVAAVQTGDYRRYITYYTHGRRHLRLRYAAARYAHSGIQCVPYAREVSHINLSGNAFLWWAEAPGRYARGDVPAQGAVLNFRAIGRMPLGHVAVVTSVLDNRTILVTQANWVRGSITNDVTMQDVSPNNDWSQVEVELGDSSTWGAPYPTYGFIYNKPDTGAGTVIAAAAQGNEVAEAPAAPVVATDAPDRNLQ
jgi:surface antigen